MKRLKKSISKEQIAGFVLIIILVFTGIIRYGLLDVPLERDEGEYAYAGQLILQGIPPYQEAFNMKFPGIYAVYALLLAVFGQSGQGIHMALLIVNAMTIIFVFLLAKHLVNLWPAVISAAVFALLSVSQSIQGMSANAEHFVILFTTSGLLVMLRGLAASSLARFFTAGLLLGSGFVIKQHGFAFSVFAALYILFDALNQRPLQWRRPALRLFLFACGVLTVFTCLCLIMAWTGVFRSFWFWTFDYASTYISQVSLRQAWHDFIKTFTAIVRAAPLLWILVGFGFFSLTTKSIAKPQRVFLLMFTIFSLVSICPGFYFRPHYFVLLLPCASLLAAATVSMFVDFLSRFSIRKIQYGAAIFLIVISLFQSIYKQRNYLFHMTPFQISRAAYWVNPFPESIKIADFIRKRTSPMDRIAVLGSEPQIFFYSQRRSASAHIYMYPMMETHDLALGMQKDFIKDVASKNPKYLVFVSLQTSWSRRPDSHNNIFQWFDAYLRSGDLRLVGIVELLEEESVYHWEPDVKWPVPSRFWVAVFERIS